VAAFVGAASWVLSGPFLSSVQLWNHMAGAAWLPWILLASDRAFDTGRREHVLLWGLAVAAPVVAGSPESVVAGGLLSVVLGLRHVLREASLRVAMLRWLKVGAGGIAAGMALSAAQWLPTLAVAAQGARLSIPGALRTFWSVHPARLLDVILPLQLSSMTLPREVRAMLFESREAFLASLYSGLTVAFLAGVGVATRSRRALTLGAMLVGLVLLALGRHTPVYGFLATLLPPLEAFRYPSKAMIFASFLMAGLAAVGVDALPAGRHPRPRWSRAIEMLVLAAPVAAASAAALIANGILVPEGLPGLGQMSLQPLLAPAAWRLTLAATLGASLLLLRVWVLRGWSPRWIAPVAAGMVVLDLFVAQLNLNPTAPRELYDLRPPIMDELRVEDDSRVYIFDYALPGRSERYLGYAGGFRLAPGPPLPWRAAAAARTYPHPFTLGSLGLEGSYVADNPMLYPRFLDRLTRGLFNAEESPAELRLLQAGAVSRVVSLHERGFEELIPLAVRPSLFAEPVRVFRVPDPLPRAFTVGTLRVVDDATALRLLGDPEVDLGAEALAAGGAPLRAGAPLHASTEILRRKADRVRIRVETDAQALVVLVDTYDPGWTVTVDGRPERARRINLAFRGVVVPAGRHDVEWSYRPRSVMVGLTLSALALILAAVVGLATLRGRLSPPSPGPSRRKTSDV
jgi:hypothetical protein